MMLSRTLQSALRACTVSFFKVGSFIQFIIVSAREGNGMRSAMSSSKLGSDIVALLWYLDIPCLTE